MEFFQKSLGAKILGITSLVLVVFFGILFWTTFFMQRASTLHEVEVNAERTAEMLSMAIREPMSIGDNAGTTQKFMDVGTLYKDIDIHLTNFKGNITYSTAEQFLRQDLFASIKNPELTRMVEERLKKDGISQTITELDGVPSYLEVKSIPNEPACHHCHGGNQPMLGVLIMRQDISRQMDSLMQGQLKAGGIMAVGMVVLLACRSFFMRRAVFVPVHDVAETTSFVFRRIAAPMSASR